MKLLPMLLTNLLCVGVGIGAYDMIKSDDGPQGSQADVGLMEGSDLEARIAQLENAKTGVLLSGPDAPTISKKEILELIRKHTPAASGTEVAAPTGEGASTIAMGVDRPKVEVKAEDYQVEGFRQMMEKVEDQRRAEREEERAKANEARLKTRLDRMELGLNDNQKDELIKLSGTHRKKMRDTFTKLRESGAGREEYRTAMEPLREELTKAVENIVPGDDAQKVVQTLGGGGMRRGGFDRGGGGGTGRARRNN